jgi:hypothetical protein
MPHDTRRFGFYGARLRGIGLLQARHVVRMGRFELPQNAQLFEPKMVCFGSGVAGNLP